MTSTAHTSPANTPAVRRAESFRGVKRRDVEKRRGSLVWAGGRVS